MDAGEIGPAARRWCWRRSLVKTIEIQWGVARFRGVNATLLPPGSFDPQFHIYCDFARLPLKDGLPHFRTVPARFGGSDEVVDG